MASFPVTKKGKRIEKYGNKRAFFGAMLNLNDWLHEVRQRETMQGFHLDMKGEIYSGDICEALA